MTEAKQELSGYEVFKSEARAEISKINGIMKLGLSDDPETMIGQLVIAETLYCRFHYLLARANYYLDIAEYQNLPAKDSGTEIERRLAVQAAVAEQRQIRNIIEGFVKALQMRIQVGQSRLAYTRENLKKLN